MKRGLRRLAKVTRLPRAGGLKPRTPTWLGHRLQLKKEARLASERLIRRAARWRKTKLGYRGIEMEKPISLGSDIRADENGPRGDALGARPAHGPGCALPCCPAAGAFASPGEGLTSFTAAKAPGVKGKGQMRPPVKLFVKDQRCSYQPKRDLRDVLDVKLGAEPGASSCPSPANGGPRLKGSPEGSPEDSLCPHRQGEIGVPKRLPVPGGGKSHLVQQEIVLEPCVLPARAAKKNFSLCMANIGK